MKKIPGIDQNRAEQLTGGLQTGIQGVENILTLGMKWNSLTGAAKAGGGNKGGINAGSSGAVLPKEVESFMGRPSTGRLPLKITPRGE
jgi:hypothetical protein